METDGDKSGMLVFETGVGESNQVFGTVAATE
jgi:hypothetical protein